MCGIFGQINKSNKIQFNKPCFITSGIANDTRGGDSCGVFIDGSVEYGIGKTKMFSDFYINSELLRNTDRCQVALGHCRKASVGAKTIAEAQPCIIKNGDKIEYVVIHNGTILNYKELAAKYIPNVDITNMTDSQVLTHIFYNTGFDVLSEYNGGAAFVAVDYRCNRPKVYFWKGASKSYSYSKEESEERPLYLFKTKESLYFSSLRTWLEPFSDFQEILTFSSNSLVTLNEDFRLETIKKFDRSNCVQVNSSVQVYNPYYGYSYCDDYSNNNYRNHVWNQGYISKKKEDDAKIQINAVGLFTKNGIACNGVKYIGLNGSTDVCSIKYPCYFIDGYLLKNKDCYEFLRKFCTNSGLELSDLAICIPETLEYLSMFPAMIGKIDEDPYFYYYKNIGETECFTGRIQFFGSNEILVIDQGSISLTIQTNSYDTLLDMYKKASEFKVDATQIYNLINTECENAL